MSGTRARWLAVASLLLGTFAFLVTDVDARGRGGGGRGGGRGSISRSGPAAGGSFRGSGGSFGGRSSVSRPSTRPAGGALERPRQPERPSTQPERPSTRPEQRPGEGDPGDRQQDRQDWADDAREDRQDYRDGARYQRAEYAEDLYTYDEWTEDRRSWAGAALTAATFRSLSCTPTTVVVGSTTYYQCGSSWYNRAYQGGQVTYIVVNPPPGS